MRNNKILECEVSIHRSIKLSPIIGIGYWKDVYDLEKIEGEAHNIVIPFVRFQFAYIVFKTEPDGNAGDGK